MRTRRPSPEHQEAVSRRLALLSQELASMTPRDPEGSDVPDEPDPPVPLGDHTRVRPRFLLGGQGEEEEGPGPPPVPLPGRHASRRVRSVPDVVPEPLRGRVALGSPQLALVAVVVAMGLAVTTWWVARGEPQPVAAPPVSDQQAVLATPAATVAAGASPASVPAEVTVDVAGKVRRPGIVVLEAGARVVDAIEAAGGARAGVDLSALNLARLLVDGEQVLVGLPAPSGVAAGSLTSPPSPAGALVDLNTATGAELETLPEVGPVTAEAIVAWRTEHGGFTTVDELLEVDGIGEATLATIAPHVTV